MDDLRLALRAFRWRRGGSIVVLVAGALTVAAAALGPLFASAAAESVLQDRLVQAQADQTTIAFRVASDVSYPASIRVVSDEQAGRGSVPGYGPQVDEALVATSAVAPGGLTALTTAVSREGVCAHLEIVAGTCELGPEDALVSERTAEAMGWKPGSRLTLGDLRRYDTSQSGSEIATTPATVTVVGVYRPQSVLDPYWAGRVYYFPFHSNPDGPITVDTLFVAPELFPTLVHPTPGRIVADLVLTDPASLRVADVPTLRAAVEGYLGPDTSDVRPTTGMLELLDRFEQERNDLALAAGVVTAQLALLAWLLLYLVVTDTSEARGDEVALAKLRGLPPRAVAAVALREPVVLLLLAVPVGLLLSYGLVTALARSFLADGVPVVVTPATWVAVGLAFLGGLVAAALASRRMFTRPVLEQWSTTGDADGRRGGMVVDVVLAVVALTGFVVLNRGGGTGEAGSALGWLAPGLLVVAAGLLLVRLAGPVLAVVVRSTRASHRIGLFLGSRQAVRRPAGLRLAALLAVTIGLATFAVDAQAAAAESRAVRAGADVGAITAVSVQIDPASDLQTAVHTVDPEGRWAMVVADWIPSGGLAGRLLAVESDRLAAVAQWAPEYGDLSAEQVAALVSPPLPPPVPLATDRLRLRIDASAVPDDAPDVVVSYRDGADSPTLATAGPLLEGVHDYEVELPCLQQTCLLHGLVLERAQSPGTETVDLTVEAVQVPSPAGWVDVDARLTDAASWRLSTYTGTAGGQLAAGPGGLRLSGDLPRFTSPFVQYADVPDPLPLVTATEIARTGDPLRLVDGFGREVQATSVGESVVLPLVGSRGSLTDLTALRRVAQQIDDSARWAVWLGPDAPADAVERLAAAGIAVDRVSTLGEREDQLGREGPALALRLLLVCAVVGALLAAGALAISVAVTGRRRSYELAALRAVGVPRRSLLTACVLEQALLLGTGLVVGVPVGAAVARLALPMLPQSSSATSVPLAIDLQTAAVVGFAVVTGLLLLLTAVVAGAALLRQAVPERLREVAA